MSVGMTKVYVLVTVPALPGHNLEEKQAIVPTECLPDELDVGDRRRTKESLRTLYDSLWGQSPEVRFSDECPTCGTLTGEHDDSKDCKPMVKGVHRFVTPQAQQRAEYLSNTIDHQRLELSELAEEIYLADIEAGCVNAVPLEAINRAADFLEEMADELDRRLPWPSND